MNIAKNTVVALHYQMYDEKNQLIDQTTEEPMIYLHGGYDGIFPVVEEKLHGKAIGDKIDVHLTCEDAFGEVDTQLIRIEDIDNFPVAVKVGMMFEGEDEDGEIMLYRVTDIAEGKAIVDANHPLAGLKIRFVAKVVDVRMARDDEINHGHAHNASCCGHEHHDSDHDCCGGGDCGCQH